MAVRAQNRGFRIAHRPSDLEVSVARAAQVLVNRHSGLLQPVSQGDALGVTFGNAATTWSAAWFMEPEKSTYSSTAMTDSSDARRWGALRTAALGLPEAWEDFPWGEV